MVIEQSCPTNMTKIDNLTKADWWDKPNPSSPYLPMAPFPCTLDLSTYPYGKEEQIGEMEKLVETSPRSQTENIIGKATPTILSQDSLDPYMAHVGVDDFNINGHITKMNNLFEMPYPETTPSWIKKYEPPSDPPIATLLESLPNPELKPLPVITNDTVPVILNQEAQLAEVLNTHKEAIGWDISKHRDNDLKILVSDLSVFGTTFADCLQNFSTLLKQCMEMNLILIYKRCHSTEWEGMMTNDTISKERCRVDQAIVEVIFKLPPPILDQQTQSLSDHFKNNHRSWSSMLAQYTPLIRANHCRTFYERFSAMLTRPPDWPCSFETLRGVPNLTFGETPS